MSCNNVNCSYSTWENTPCLNDNNIISTRTINNSQQGNNSTNCSINQNDYVKIETCNLSDNCLLSNWSDWSTCSNNKQFRTRTISNSPKSGADECPQSLNAYFETRDCSNNTNGLNTCTYSNWSNWSPCSTTSGLGYQIRTRGGSNCSLNVNNFIEYQPCNINPNDNCQLSDWSWSPCSTKCGTGFRIGTRTILNNQKNDGTPCPIDYNSYFKTEVCTNNEYCPINCSVSDWSNCNSDFIKTRTITKPQNCGSCTENITSENCNYRYVGCYNDSSSNRTLSTNLGVINNSDEC
jgi:hypothetical protein